MGHTIRPMQEDDWSEIVEIYIQGIQSNNKTFEIECPSYEAWDKSHVKECRLVAEVDGEVAAWAALQPFSAQEHYKGVAELSLYIDTNRNHKDIAEALLQAVVEESEKAGFWSLQAAVFESDASSIKLYEKCGFRMIGYRERLAKDRFGVWRSIALMEHRITSDIAGGCGDCPLIKAKARDSYA